MPPASTLKKRDVKKSVDTSTVQSSPIQPVNQASHESIKPSVKRRGVLSLLYTPSPHYLLDESIHSSINHSLIVFLITFALYYETAYPSITGGDSGELVITACNFGVAHPPGYPTYSLVGGLWIRACQFFMSLFDQSINPARCMNLLSALMGAVTSAILHRICLLMTNNPAISLIGSIGFAWSPTVWLYSIQGEVFAMNNLFCSILIYLSIKYYEAESRYLAFRPADVSDDPSINQSNNQSSQRARAYLAQRVLLYAYMGALACGLSLTNQHTAIFTVIPTVMFVCYSLYTCRLLTQQTIAHLTALVLLGFSPYLYVVHRAYAQIPDSWGDQRTWSGFWHHFLRSEYGTFQLAATETSEDPGMLARLAVYLSVMQEESLYVIPLLACWGAVGFLQAENRRAVKLSAALQLYSYGLYVGVFHKLANLDMRPLFRGVQARFWQQPNMYLYIWGAYGLSFVLDTCFQYATKQTYGVDYLTQSINPVNNQTSSSVDKQSVNQSSNQSNNPTINQTERAAFLVRARSVTGFLLSLLFCVGQLVTHWYRVDHHESTSFALAGRKILESFPRDSLVLLNGDLNNNLIKYPQACENVRPDVRLVSLQLMTWPWFVAMQAHAYPNVTFPGQRYHVNFPGSFTLKRFLDANNKKFPIFLCGPYKEGDYSLIASRAPETKYYDEYPYGACVQLLKQPPANLTQFLRSGLSGLLRINELPPFDPRRDTPDTWEAVLYTDVAQRMVYLTSYTSFHANQRMEDQSLIQLAYELTEEMIQTPAIHDALIQRKLLSALDYRACGVIYGQYSALLKQRGDLDKSQLCATKMRRMWRRYIEMEAGDSEIKRFLESDRNPYTGDIVKERWA